VFVVFGWQKTFAPRESLLRTHCHHCNHDVSWRIWHETEWVSLFFVRLLPFLRKYRLACEVCRDSVPLDAKMCRLARNREGLDPRASRELHDSLVRLIEDHQYGGMTEGQKRYHRETRRQRKESATE
jgi:hypothetical protein